MKAPTKHRQWMPIVAVIVSGAASIGAAHASNLMALSVTEYADGTTTWPPGTPGSPVITSLATPGAYSYSDTALEPESDTGNIIPSSNYPGTYPGASFYDAFLISITSGDGSSISSTIDLGSSFDVTNFQERLYRYTGTAPTVGAVPGALDFWTTAVTLDGTSGTVAELPSTALSAGTYVLEIRGDVTGSDGGAYGGTLQLSPVPLPASLPLLMGGLATLVVVLRRRPRRS